MDISRSPQVPLGQQLAPIVSRLWMVATPAGAEAARAARALPPTGTVVFCPGWLAPMPAAIVLRPDEPRRGGLLLN